MWICGVNVSLVVLVDPLAQVRLHVSSPGISYKSELMVGCQVCGPSTRSKMVRLEGELVIWVLGGTNQYSKWLTFEEESPMIRVVGSKEAQYSKSNEDVEIHTWQREYCWESKCELEVPRWLGRQTYIELRGGHMPPLKFRNPHLLSIFYQF